jgi:hypothetical protein
MSPNSKIIHKRSTGQKIRINSTDKLKPGELTEKDKSDFKNITIVEELEHFLGEGNHGHVYTAKKYEVNGGIVPYAVKNPPEYVFGDKRKLLVEKWLRKIKKLKEIGLTNVVDHAEVIRDKLYLTDLRMYGEVLDFELNMDKKVVKNFDLILLNVTKDLGKIHDSGLILTDAFGSYAFRAWFILKSKTRDGFVGERVICDVGGVERFPSVYVNPNYGDKQFIHRVKKRYKQINLLSLMGIVSFDESFSREIFDKYVSSCKKPKHIMYAREIYSELKKDKTKIIEEFNELAADY